MFFARYIVLQFGKQEIPFLISDIDRHGWERPRGNTYPPKEKVVSAGYVTWEESNPDSVRCFGEGEVVRELSRNTTRTVESRGDVDALLIEKLLAKPLRYVVLSLDGVKRAIFASVTDPEEDHERMVLRYQVYPSRCAVSAGEVNFGHADEKPMRCYGEAVFIGRPHFARPSLGADDVAFMKKHLVRYEAQPVPPRASRLF